MKKIQNSKVVWINAIVLILLLFDSDFFKAFGVSEHNIVIISSIIAKTTAALNIILRLFFTQEPIENPFKQ